MKTIAVMLLTLVLAATGFLVYIHSGAYNIAASDHRYGPLQWILQTTLKNSVRARAGAIKAPPLYGQNKDKGFKYFDEMCVLCHGAPGVVPSEIGRGLRPEPPDLSMHVGDWSTAELFWIVKHGFTFTGMPSFGTTQPDEEIWDIVAFLEELPDVSPEDYRNLRKRIDAEERNRQYQQEHRRENPGQGWGIIYLQAI
jgi:mono/diheme cytochrome c family protein